MFVAKDGSAAECGGQASCVIEPTAAIRSHDCVDGSRADDSITRGRKPWIAENIDLNVISHDYFPIGGPTYLNFCARFPVSTSVV